jgi:hypothetical protein
LLLDQIVISLLENPNTIRTFSAEFPQKALCSGFQTSAERQLRAQIQTSSASAHFLMSGHCTKKLLWVAFSTIWMVRIKDHKLSD